MSDKHGHLSQLRDNPYGVTPHTNKIDYRIHVSQTQEEMSIHPVDFQLCKAAEIERGGKHET